MKKLTEWILSLVAAFLLIQTLYFKFTASPESVYIFTQVGMEPWGRIGTGVVELTSGVLLLINRLRLFGALTAAGVMVGAIFFHLTLLGIEIMEDRGQLFYYALTVMACCLGILILRRKDLPFIGYKL